MNETLTQVLQTQLELSQTLLSVLEQECQAVLNGDLQLLGNVSLSKEDCCGRIAAMESHWPAAMRGTDVQQWMATQDADTRHAWDHLVVKLRQCRRQNDANGMLIAERQQWIAKKLAPQSENTYSAGGQTAHTQTTTWNQKV